MGEKKDHLDNLLPRRVFAVSDFEISNGVLKFINVKGFIKKKKVTVREIPISEISSIESYKNELDVTWDGVSTIFFKKNSYESFDKLKKKVASLIEENNKALEKNEKSLQLEVDVKRLLDQTLLVVDGVFDVLWAMNSKRIDWYGMTDRCKSLCQGLNFFSQQLPSFTLNFADFVNAIAKQTPKDVAAEASKILRLLYEYFNGLKPADNTLDIHPNFVDATTLVNSYYTLNDILLGRIIDGNDNLHEISFLEHSLQQLAEKTSFKVNLEELQASLNSLGAPDVVSENVVDYTREIFKETLSKLYSSS